MWRELRQAGVPDQYQFPRWDLVSDQIRLDLRKWCAGIRLRVQHGRGLVMHGDVGTGKSSAAGLIARTAVEAHLTARWFYVPDMLARLQDRSTRQDVLNQNLGHQLVVWDDFGARDLAEWDVEWLDQLVEGRYARRRSTIVTTNWSKDRFVADRRLARMVDRWRERMGSLYLVGDSRRRAPEPDDDSGQQALL